MQHLSSTILLPDGCSTTVDWQLLAKGVVLHDVVGQNTVLHTTTYYAATVIRHAKLLQL